MQIYTQSLENAVQQLERSNSYLNGELARNDEGLRVQFRAATIHAFEVTFELAIKMMRRQLAQIVVAPSELQKMAFMDLIRTAAAAGMVKNVPSFMIYRDMRNITSHTYDSEAAEEVISVIDDFLQDVRFLLNVLKQRNGAHNN